MNGRMSVSEVLESALYVSDLPAAEKFYTEILGLTFFSKLEGRHVFLRCGDRMVLLFDAEVTAVSAGGSFAVKGRAHTRRQRRGTPCIRCQKQRSRTLETTPYRKRSRNREGDPHARRQIDLLPRPVAKLPRNRLTGNMGDSRMNCSSRHQTEEVRPSCR